MPAHFLIADLLDAARDGATITLFERRRLIDEALEKIEELRQLGSNASNPLFNDERSPVKEIKRVRSAIARVPDHHVKAAMLIAVELIRYFDCPTEVGA